MENAANQNRMKDPREMTPEERFDQFTRILARGVMRAAMERYPELFRAKEEETADAAA